MRMVDMPLEFGGQGRTYLLKLCCVLAGALFFFTIEYILLIMPRLLKVSLPCLLYPVIIEAPIKPKR